MRRFSGIIFPVGILILIKFVFLFPVFDSLEFKAQDTMFKMRGPKEVSGDVVVIAIDDETFSALNETWPFPREYYAKLIENLNQAGARLIVFDVEFTENSNPESDETLAEAAAKYNNVIFAGKVLHAKTPRDPSQKLTPIQSIMQRDLSWGVVNMYSDVDNVIRKYTLYEVHDENPVYSIGVSALANYRVYQPDWDKHITIDNEGLKLTDKKIPLYQHNKALINYYGPAHTFPQYSLSTILDDDTMAMPGYMGFEMDEFYEVLASGELKNKVVLIGASVDELHDKFPTPFGGEWTPGVEIHANFIEMVLNEDYLGEVNHLLYLLIELIILVIMWFTFNKLKPQFSVILLILLIAGQFALAYLIFIRMSMLIPVVQTALVLVLVYVASVVSHYLATMKEKRYIRSAFQQYLAPELVNELLKNPQNLTYGGSLQEITVLFSDIRSFTTYSENHTPAETVNILKEYLTEMVKIITVNRGILDKFVGDEVMALFGTPVPTPEHALNACKVALQMRDKMTELQAQWIARGQESFEIGIGVNTGQAVVGNLGSEQIFDYTAIGDTINLGARLESINKEYQTAKHIIISEFTLEHVKDQVEVRYLDEVKVKGKNKAVKIYELIDLKPVSS